MALAPLLRPHAMDTRSADQINSGVLVRIMAWRTWHKVRCRNPLGRASGGRHQGSHATDWGTLSATERYVKSARPATGRRVRAAGRVLALGVTGTHFYT